MATKIKLDESMILNDLKNEKNAAKLAGKCLNAHFKK